MASFASDPSHHLPSGGRVRARRLEFIFSPSVKKKRGRREERREKKRKEIRNDEARGKATLHQKLPQFLERVVFSPLGREIRLASSEEDCNDGVA